ncbi:ATP-dependent helicase, partial [bacterium]|nr:ATP-dependent helicase [bacterium]
MSNEHFLANTKPIDHDSKVDDGIKDCLQIGSGESFITFAGAGSGKTYSLKRALDFLKEEHTSDFSRQGKQIAVITFTNNAANEIKDRIERNPIFAISTIHSFCWLAIAGFNEDIRKWYLEEIPKELAKTEDEELRGRAGKASDARKRRIIRLKEKIEWLAEPHSFIYDPNGVNSSQNALSHADVLKIFSHFLNTKLMMVEVLINKYPFIFIDESQDTDKGVIDAFFSLQKRQPQKVIIGLLGDTMQRIFGGGEPQLGKTQPQKWKEFDKEMNHRSARRIVGLGNQIRSEDDGRMQFARNGASDGCVRYFLLPHGLSGKEVIEDRIRSTMAETTGDADWTDIQSKETAILLLEHKMAGRRLGFDGLWEALSKSKKIADRITEGGNTEINYFSNIVFPLAKASLKDDRAEVMTILRGAKSPLLEGNKLAENVGDPLLLARNAEQALKKIVSDEQVTFLQVLEIVADHNLLPIPSKLKAYIKSPDESDPDPEMDIQDGEEQNARKIGEKSDDSEIEAWALALETEFFQIQNYRDYVNQNSIYRTHQGVKGNEFERVMVIMDDDEAGGFL